MCRIITVFAKNRPEILPLTFDVDKFTTEKPICTCYISDKEGDGKILRNTFVEECLRPMLEEVSYGDIVIEIR